MGEREKKESLHTSINTNMYIFKNKKYHLILYSSPDLIDIDECGHSNGGCDHGCNNSEGSFECSCRDGFTLTGDRLRCQDVDECLLATVQCSYGCKNSPGSFTCLCDSGFSLNADGFSCSGIYLPSYTLMATC